MVNIQVKVNNNHPDLIPPTADYKLKVVVRGLQINAANNSYPNQRLVI